MDDMVYDNEWVVGEPEIKYWNKMDYLHQEETREIIGICMEVHRELGFGFLEAVYKDAIEYELNLKNISYEREKLCKIRYKDIILKKTFNADFFIFDKVMLEVKAQRDFAEDNFGQTLNYLSASGCAVGLLVNFGKPSLQFRRLARTIKNKSI